MPSAPPGSIATVETVDLHGTYSPGLLFVLVRDRAWCWARGSFHTWRRRRHQPTNQPTGRSQP